MSEEHRLQKRVAKNLLAQFATPTASFFAYVQDLATGGLGANINRKIEVGTAVEVKLNVPKHETMIMKGTVVWRRELPALSRSKYQVGVDLAECPETFVKYVSSLLKRDYDRRQSPRFRDILEIHANEVLDLMDAAIADVSAEGLYVRTNQPLQVGAQFELALVNKEDLPEPLYCLGEVVASFECDPDDLDHPYGAGVKILSFVGDDGERFAEYIKSLDELYSFHWPEAVKAVAEAASAPAAEEEDIPIE